MGRVHVVERGDCFASIAKRYGFAHWRTLESMPENQELVRQRGGPHVLLEGDRVALPDARSPALFRAQSTGQRHQFVVRELTVKLKVRLRDRGGVTLANRPCRLYIERRAAPIDCALTGDATLEQDIPADARRVDLLVWVDDAGVYEDESLCHRFPLRVGHLDPVDAMSGVQSRLNNLGFRCPTTRALDEKTRNALRAFQRKNRLDATGELDDATRSQLLDRHSGT